MFDLFLTPSRTVLMNEKQRRPYFSGSTYFGRHIFFYLLYWLCIDFIVLVSDGLTI